MAKSLAFTGRVKGYRSLKNPPLHRWKPKRKGVVVKASVDAFLNLGLDLFWRREALQGLSETGLRRGDKGTLRMKGLLHQDAEVRSTDDCREGHKSLFVVHREADRPPEAEGRKESNSAAVGRSVLSAGLGIGLLQRQLFADYGRKALGRFDA